MATSLLPVIGKPAPDFTLPSTTGEPVSLQQFKGKKTVILYFYPKDETPGLHARGVRLPRPLRRVREAQRRDPRRLDRPASSRTSSSGRSTSCRSRCSSDEDATVSKLFGVYKQKNLYGKKYMGIERTTFVIDRTGRIAQIYPKVKVDGHIAGRCSSSSRED